MYIALHVKYPLFLSDFNQTRILTDFSKNTQISNLTKTPPVGAELFHGDGQTDMTKLTVACRHFARAPYIRRTDIIPISLRKASNVSEFEITDSDHMSTRSTNSHQFPR